MLQAFRNRDRLSDLEARTRTMLADPTAASAIRAGGGAGSLSRLDEAIATGDAATGERALAACERALAEARHAEMRARERAVEPIAPALAFLRDQLRGSDADAETALRLRAALFRSVAEEALRLTWHGEPGPRHKRLTAILIGTGKVANAGELIGPRAAVGHVTGPLASWVRLIGDSLQLPSANTETDYVRMVVHALDGVIDQLAQHGRWLEAHVSLKAREHLIGAGVALIGHSEIEADAAMFVEWVGRHVHTNGGPQ